MCFNGKVKLNQALLSSADLNVVLSVPASSPLQLRKGSSGGFNNSATFTFSQSAGDTEQAFQVRLKSRSVSTTANGWVTSVVTADPDGGSRGDVSDKNATLTHILMDRQNLASLEGKSDGSANSNTGCAAASDACANRKEITLAEGDKASGLELTGLAGSVTAPSGVTFTLTPVAAATSTATWPHPRAASGDTTITGQTFATIADNTDLGPAIATSDDALVNGDRYLLINDFTVTPANRGVDAADAPGQVLVKITDDEKGEVALNTAASFPVAKSSGSDKEKAAVADLGVLEEGDTEDIHLVLSKALSRANMPGADGTLGNADDIAPLEVTVGLHSSSDAAFTGADYSLALKGTTTGVTAAAYDASANGGKGALVLQISGQPSVASVPLTLTITDDSEAQVSDQEGPADLEFSVSVTAWDDADRRLGCGSITTGCYEPAEAGSERFHITASTKDEGGAITISAGSVKNRNPDANGAATVDESNGSTGATDATDFFDLTFTRSGPALKGKTDSKGDPEGYIVNLADYFELVLGPGININKVLDILPAEVNTGTPDEFKEGNFGEQTITEGVRTFNLVNLIFFPGKTNILRFTPSQDGTNYYNQNDGAISIQRPAGTLFGQYGQWRGRRPSPSTSSRLT